MSCHYHSGSEFVTTDTKTQVVGQGELHCIFPSDDPKSPRVFGELPVSLDCSLLENLSAHTANSPALGGVGEPVFGVSPPPSMPAHAPKKPAAHG